MFDKWLGRNRGMFSSATDIGTGCGILSFLMAKHGIEKIHATDINPNAVYSTRKEIERLKLTGKIIIEQLPLFGSQKKPED
jgi:methylase of polypeptide subunit release factors